MKSKIQSYGKLFCRCSSLRFKTEKKEPQNPRNQFLLFPTSNYVECNLNDSNVEGRGETVYGNRLMKYRLDRELKFKRKKLERKLVELDGKANCIEGRVGL
jgi:hypothetical protein